MTRTFSIVNGHPVADLGALDGPAALVRKKDVEARLGALRGDPAKAAEREALKRENEALDARLREWREETKRQNARPNFAGLGSPLHEAIVDRFPPDVVLELEGAALARLAGQTERRRIGNPLPPPPGLFDPELTRSESGEPSTLKHMALLVTPTGIEPVLPT
jgi:hypothetical protein